MWRVERWIPGGSGVKGRWAVVAEGVSEEEALAQLGGMYRQERCGRALRPDAAVGEWHLMWTSRGAPLARERYV